MLETLQTVDVAVFRFVNDTLANPVTDFVMPLVTSDWNLRIAYGITMVVLAWRGSKEMRWLVAFSILTVAIADLISSGFLKEVIGRIRPCHTLENVHLLVVCGSGKSMPSSHAANAFAQAAFFTVSLRRHGWWLFSIATLIALSRVFVGVHYPFDIVAGAMVGCAVGIATAWLNSSLRRAKESREHAVSD